MSRQMTISEILADIHAADEILHRFERKYGIHSDVFYELYGQGLLDDGENLEDFAEWGGMYKLRTRREATFRQQSRQMVETLQTLSPQPFVRLLPCEIAVVS